MAGELQKYRSSSFGAEEKLYFLEVPTDLKAPDTKAFHMAFLRMESSTVETGVETETIPDVTQKVQPTEVKSYAPSQPFSGTCLKEDPVYKYIQHLYDTRATGGKAHVNHLEVRRFDGDKAFKTDVVVAVESFTNDAGDLAKYAGTFSYAGDSIEGTAVIDNDTGVAKFTPKGDA